MTSNGPPADPFSGSPSDAWADGTAGIAIPAAKAHGRYTAAQVRSAYEKTSKLLAAGNLNWPPLRGGAPTAFAEPADEAGTEGFPSRAARHRPQQGRKTRRTPGRGSPRSPPGSTQFVTTVIKVHGKMSAGIATSDGIEVLRVKVDYLFVFAVEPPGKPADWTRIIQQRYGYVDFAQWDDPGGALEPWITVSSETAGGMCDSRDGYIHPDFPQGAPDSVKPSGKPQDPYSSPPRQRQTSSAATRSHVPEPGPDPARAGSTGPRAAFETTRAAAGIYALRGRAPGA